MKYLVHQKFPVEGWSEVDSYDSYNEIPDEDKGFFDWLLSHNENVMTQGHTMWEIKQ